MPDEMRRAFEGAVGADNVRDGGASYGVDGLLPSLVVTPPDIDRLSRTMAAAHEHKTAVAPRGGGTRMDLGNPPERLDVVVDLSGLDAVVQHNPADLTVTVQSGMTLGSLQRILGDQGQFLAIDPPLPDQATVGGTLAS
ncbi:MAG: FAD-binding oxidoreductase, partial [Chloroflexi bacterium]|nr:FAD-binding oxidoreductase [Chloroflexota bacterium]